VVALLKVLNIHERRFAAPASAVGSLIDTLASTADRLWPHRSWPRMTFDRPLGVGAKGGHGPIRYVVESHEPGVSVRFRFTGPAGFDGHHGFEMLGSGGREVVLRHTLQMETKGPAVISWPLIYRPLHDALLEDAMAQAAVSLGVEPEVRGWSRWVKLLRSLLAGKRTARRP
jgi:hypothetical protein